MAMEEAPPDLSMEHLQNPLGFVSIAAAISAVLSEEGQVVLTVGPDDTIRVHRKDVVVFVDAPVLVVNPAFIEDYTEDGKIVVDRAGCTLLQESIQVIVAETPEER